MSFRMNVKIKGTDKWFGDDHKLYGYVPYEQVRKSFNLIYSYMLAQWKNNFMFFEGFEEPEKEFYDTICAVNNTPELEMDADSFRWFARYYIEEFKNRDTLYFGKPDKDFVDKISKYMNKLANDPRDKILKWE